MSARGAAWLALAAGLGATAAAMLVLFSFDHPFALRLDNKLVLFPMTLEAWRKWTTGILPAWSTGLWSGYPLLADPDTAAFYLPYVPGFALTREPHLRAFDVAAALHLGILVAGTVRLVATLGVGTAGIALAALLALTSAQASFFVATFLQGLAAFAWWPWVILAAERLARDDRAGPGIVLGSAALAAQVFGGYPEFAVYSGVLAAIWLLAAGGGRRFSVRLARLAGLAIAAILVAGPQLLPTVLALPESRRGTPLSLEEATLDRVAVWPLGPLLDPRHDGRAAFLGMATLVLAIVGATSRRRRAGLLAVVTIVALALSLGPATPLYGWLHALPVFGHFRSATKFLCVVELTVGCLAAAGLDRLFGGRRRAVVAGALLGLLALGEHAVYAQRRVALYAKVPPHEEPLARLLDALAADVAPLAAAPGAGPSRRVWIAAPDFAFGNLGMVFGLESLRGGIIALPSERQLRLLSVPPFSKASLELFGVGLLYLPFRACPETALDWLTLPRPSGCVLMPEAPPPRYTLVHAVRPVPTYEEMDRSVRERPFGPVPVLAPAHAVGARTARGRVAVSEYRAGAVALDVEAAGDGLLLIRESGRRGWTARIDGVSAPIYPAAGFFFAVPVPSGTHTVHLTFRPPGLGLGLAMAAAWLGLACAIAPRRALAMLGLSD